MKHWWCQIHHTGSHSCRAHCPFRSLDTGYPHPEQYLQANVGVMEWVCQLHVSRTLLDYNLTIYSYAFYTGLQFSKQHWILILTFYLNLDQWTMAELKTEASCWNNLKIGLTARYSSPTQEHHLDLTGLLRCNLTIFCLISAVRGGGGEAIRWYFYIGTLEPSLYPNMSASVSTDNTLFSNIWQIVNCKIVMVTVLEF